jgi:hypothetical protein
MRTTQFIDTRVTPRTGPRSEYCPAHGRYAKTARQRPFFSGDLDGSFIYPSPAGCGYRTMDVRLYSAAVLALYQLTLLLGIVLLPVAMVTERLGLRLPIDRVVTELGSAYERASA